MIISVIIGALIGAGFASGQEIYLFFYRYGINGIFGLIICSLLIGFVIYKTFSIIMDNNITTYKEFLNVIFKHNKIITKVMNIIINIFLLATFFIMISGFGAYFAQEFLVNNIIGAAFLAVVCFFVFMTSIKGIANISSFIVPILITCVIIIGFNNFLKLDVSIIIESLENINFNTGYKMNWILQSVIYCSYNMILIIPVLVNLKDYIKSKKQIIIISILAGIIVFILSLCIFLLLINVDVDFQSVEMPAVYAISKEFTKFRLVYGVVILLSIFTTAISIGFSFLENIVNNKKNFPQIAGIMCITSVIISNFGFSNLLEILFPLFGCLGLVQIWSIFLA